MINAPDTFPIKSRSPPTLLLRRSCLKRMFDWTTAFLPTPTLRPIALLSKSKFYFGCITTAQSVSLMQDNSCLLGRPSIASLLPPKFPSEPPTMRSSGSSHVRSLNSGAPCWNGTCMPNCAQHWFSARTCALHHPK
jgi:hypothetical protein